MSAAALKAWLSVLSAFLKLVPQALIYWAGARKGRDKERLAQREQDLKTASAALRATRNVKHDDDSVRNDARNRDEG